MVRRKHYRLLCPISRALDRVGDRWTLLILRDLHAGPVRFNDLGAGLPGLATNLLSTRLRQLEEDGLVEQRSSSFGVKVYALTDLGRATDKILLSLAGFGFQFPPGEDVRRPGNLRTVAITLQNALALCPPPDGFTAAGLLIDGESLVIRLTEDGVAVRYQVVEDLPLVVETNYEALMAAGDGRMPPDVFGRQHVTLRKGSAEAAQALLHWIGNAMAVIREM